MGIEFELKYRANEKALSALRQSIPGEELLYQMQTTYYDTPGGGFSARKWTLRRRMENDKSICTLKLPADKNSRREIEVCCDRIEDAILELCKLGGPEELPALAAEGLLPICGARFTRVAKTVAFADAVLELALDSGVLTGGGREIPLWEMEVELKSGSRAACTAYAQLLAAKYGLEPESHSKFRRALALYKGE